MMLRFILLKIKNKYKLYICLLIGLIFMESCVTLIVMFRTGSLNKLIQKNFVTQYEETKRFPAVISRTAAIDEKADERKLEDIISAMDSYENSWKKYLAIPLVASQRLVYMKGFKAEPSYRGKPTSFDIGYMNELKEHIEITDAISEILTHDYSIPQNAFPCYVSEYTADTYDLVVGELLSVNEELVLYIAGIIRENPNDYYWNKSLYENGHTLYVSKKVFESILADNTPELLAYEMYSLIDYRYINTVNAERINSILSQFHEKDKNIEENIQPVLTAFKREGRSLVAILYVIALPLVLLVLIFIAMIAVRIADSEMGEIAGFVSRGIGREKLILMYVIQYLLICAVTFIPGLLLGFVSGRLAAGVDDFLGFKISGGISTKVYSFTWQMIPAAIISLLLSAFVMVIPIAVKSNGTLVDHKERKTRDSNKPLWEKYFFDVVLLIVSVYLLHNYNRQLEMLPQAVLNDDSIDPMIFADATIFLVAAGLIILRVIFLIIGLIYKLSGESLSPAVYAGMLQILRTRKRSGIVSVFMVITVAMSIFNANMARTINANNEARLRLDLGADYIAKEHFELKIKGMQPPQTWKYIEPDPALYETLIKETGLLRYTKVIKDENTEARNGSKVIKNAVLMGINTKEFGMTANMKEDEGGEHWYNYLNAMASSTDGCVVSRNLADALELKVGDTFTYSRTAPVDSVGIYASAVGRVAAIVDVWPGYEKYSYSYNEDGKLVCNEQYLVVANYGTVVNTFGVTPYEVWMSKAAGKDSDEKNTSFITSEMITGEAVCSGKTDDGAGIRDSIEKMMSGTNRHLDGFYSSEADIREMKSSALVQITNGLFTVDFLVALFLCVLGFMIYWISSIRDREMLFGIYRAMGITFNEIEKMLFIEQAFLTIVSVIAGAVSGVAATILFGRLFAVVYLPKKHSLPIENVTAMSDMVRLFVILAFAVAVCMVIIRRIVKRLNVVMALKLGED